MTHPRPLLLILALAVNAGGALTVASQRADAGDYIGGTLALAAGILAACALVAITRALARPPAWAEAVYLRRHPDGILPVCDRCGTVFPPLPVGSSVAFLGRFAETHYLYGCTPPSHPESRVTGEPATS